MARLDYLVKKYGETKQLAFDLIADEWRLEGMRQAIRRELRVHSGQRSLARSIGVGRSVIRKFLEMRSTPTPPHMDLLADWVADRPDAAPPLGAFCIALLMRELDPGVRYRARLRIAEALAEIHAEMENPAPEWLIHELGDRRD